METNNTNYYRQIHFPDGKVLRRLVCDFYAVPDGVWWSKDYTQYVKIEELSEDRKNIWVELLGKEACDQYLEFWEKAMRH